jgi:hypothetical protein
MYSIVIAIMLSTGEIKMPVLMNSFSSKEKCVVELIELSKLPNFEREVHLFLGYTVVKVEPRATTIVFCVKNTESI